MDIRDLIRKLSTKEPLNPYQIAGLVSLAREAGAEIRDESTLVLENLPRVLMILDRTGGSAAPYLVDLRQEDSGIIVYSRFPRESLEYLVDLTSYKGRRKAIAEYLIPVLHEIPNWLDVVQVLSRYVLERDDESVKDRLPLLMDIVLGFFFASITQPFDPDARSEGEYALSRFVESLLKTSSNPLLQSYLPFVERGVDFLANTAFARPINSLERRVLEIKSIGSALRKHSREEETGLEKLSARAQIRALITALEEIRPYPAELLVKLDAAVQESDFTQEQRFRTDILDKVALRGTEGIERRRTAYERMLNAASEPDPEEIAEGIEFVKSVGDEWCSIVRAFQDMVHLLPTAVQTAFAELLASQILEVHKPEVKRILIDGVCRIVLQLEESEKQASKQLVNGFAGMFLETAYSSNDVGQIISALTAIESLGVTFGRERYFLMAQELIDHVLRRPLLRPLETKYTVEDDDTGEPLVLAEDVEANQAHAHQIKTLLSITASNPRIMHRLIPYLIVQIEIGRTLLRDEDLIQYHISSLLRANASVTHFLVRTLIKAIPYSLKDIGPLDTLRLTAAGLARELANRGVRPIGNFLGKLRGDIHWRGSIENFYFAGGILKYFSTGDPQVISEWMPSESLPYLSMDSWCSPSESEGIRNLCRTIFADGKIDLVHNDGLSALVSVDTSRYRDDPSLPEFSKRMVLDVIDLIAGLYNKYFIATERSTGSTVEEDLARLERIISERREIKENFLTPDLRDPLPAPVTITEGAENYAAEMERMHLEQPATPIILRAKKAGHAYAQKAAYIEERFEAFTKDLRLEALQETLATSISNSRFDGISLDNLPDALIFLDHLVQGVAVNGHSSYYLQRAGRDLRLSGRLGLTLDKVRDLLKSIKKELDDVHSAYRSWFEGPLENFLSTYPMDRLPRKLRDLTTLKHVPESDFFKNYLKTLYISDLQARDGNLRVLETFIDKIELFLNQRLAESGRRVTSDPGTHLRCAPFYFPTPEEISPCRIGLKAALLRFAENTPPYFVISTDQVLGEPEQMVSDPDFRAKFESAVETLGKQWNKSLGDRRNPALFSVRSGARISMPGMMTTITNVGINDDIAERLSETIGPWFAYDCYRRFLQEFSQAAFDAERDEFQELMDRRKAQFKVLRKAEMTGEQMKTLAFDYKERVGQLAPKVVELLDQGRFLDILIHCAVVVSHSSQGPAAQKYRRAAGIDGEWRTPVIVQHMVYGNVELESSGTGVISYNPFTMQIRGDFALGDQGTDVVDGKVSTIPVHDHWKREETLAGDMPQAWKDLSQVLFRTAEKLHFDVRLEYTIEKGRVFVLQIRKDRERRERIPALKSFGYRVIAQGTGVSGGIFRGILVTDRNQIAPYRHINRAQSIIDSMNERLPVSEQLNGFIFVVNDPVPEEIMEEVFSLPVPTALVSRLGGRGAHAADIAKSLDKVYVGQVRQVVKFAGQPEKVRFNDLDVIVGTKMIIHGQTGEIALYGTA
ncbi:MAG: PEP/pyruvate-binding domain-containing protein [Desulfomonilaceae bacterium]|nr:PEP/pyruvate-binding domain-containing protein [Desulfomonilaceae bacterium]